MINTDYEYFELTEQAIDDLMSAYFAEEKEDE